MNYPSLIPISGDPDKRPHRHREPPRGGVAIHVAPVWIATPRMRLAMTAVGCESLHIRD